LVGVFENNNVIKLVVEFAEFYKLVKQEEPYPTALLDSIDRQVKKSRVLTVFQMVFQTSFRRVRTLDAAFRLFEEYSASNLCFRKYHHMSHIRDSIEDHGVLAIMCTGADETAHKEGPKVYTLSGVCSDAFSDV